MPRGIPNSKAIDNPVASTKRVETGDFKAGQDNPRVQHSQPLPGQPALDPAVIQTVETPLEAMDQEKLAMLAFFNQMIKIRIAQSGDKQAEQIFEINVNGDNHVFRRGETKTVKRYIADHMLHMKQTTYRQEEQFGTDGAKNIVNIPTTSLKYDFSVEEDPHPRGKDWLRAAMSEA